MTRTTTAATFNHEAYAAHLEELGRRHLAVAASIRQLAAGATFTEEPTATPKAATWARGVLADLIINALADGPLSPAQLKQRIPQAEKATIDSQCHTLKLREKIFRGSDGRWCVGQPEDAAPVAPVTQTQEGSFGTNGRFHRTPERLKTPGGPVTGLPTVADLVRMVAREDEKRTTIGIIDRVEKLAPSNVKRDTISSTISAFLREGNLVRKGADATGAPFIRPAEEASAPLNGAHV